LSRIESDHTRALRRVVGDFLAAQFPSARLRDVIAAGGAPDRTLVSKVASLGWFGLELDHEYGGAGASFGDLSVIVEEAGAAASSDVLISSAALCAGAIQLGGDPDQRARWLPGLGRGEQLGTVVLPAAFGADGRGGEIEASRQPGGWVIRGSASYVLNGRTSELLVVAVKAESSPIILVVPASTPGVAVTPTPMVDATRCLDSIRFDDVMVGDSAVLARDAKSATRMLNALVNRAAVALAADAVGNAQRTLDMTVTYLRQREQFGRPIGSFQAVKHQAADMLIDLETSSELVGFAAAVVSADPGGADASMAASMAKEHACERAAASAGVALQLHGGIGYTWEHDLHIFLKRAALSEQLFGSGRWHRGRVAEQLLPTCRNSRAASPA